MSGESKPEQIDLKTESSNTEKALNKKRKRGKRGGGAKGPLETTETVALDEKTQDTQADTPQVDENEFYIDTTGTTTEGTTAQKKKKTRRGGGGALKNNNITTTTTDIHNNDILHQDQDIQLENIDFTTGRNDAKHDPMMMIDPDLQSYFLALEETLDAIAISHKNKHQKKVVAGENQDETSDESHQLLIDNVFERELAFPSLALLQDFATSRILQKIIDCPLAKDFQIVQFAHTLLSLDFMNLPFHQFASHVFQTLLDRAGPIIQNELSMPPSAIKSTSEDDEEEEKVQEVEKTMQDFISSLIEKCTGTWGDFMTDAYASHILRSLLNLLAGGSYLESGAARSKKSRDYTINHSLAASRNKSHQVPAHFSVLLNQLTTTLLTETESKGGVRELATHPTSNPILQLLLTIPTSTPHTLASLFPRSSLKKDIDLLKGWSTHTIASHLLEKAVKVMSDTQIASFYKHIVRDQVGVLVHHHVSNFVVQALIPRLSEEDLEQVIQTLTPQLSDIVWGNRVGVLVKIVESAGKYVSVQSGLVSSLLSLFQATADASLQKCAPLILHLRTFKQFEERVFVHRPHTLGSLLLQHLVTFTPPHSTPILSSILALSSTDLALWARDATCAPVLESVLKSQSTPRKTKLAFINKFVGLISTLATDKFGSRVVDKLFTSGDLGCKEWIAQELLDASSKITGSFHAGFVVRNCLLDLFKRRRDEWVGYWKGVMKEGVKEKKKRNGKKSGDEIDAIFE